MILLRGMGRTSRCERPMSTPGSTVKTSYSELLIGNTLAPRRCEASFGECSMTDPDPDPNNPVPIPDNPNPEPARPPAPPETPPDEPPGVPPPSPDPVPSPQRQPVEIPPETPSEIPPGPTFPGPTATASDPRVETGCRTTPSPAISGSGHFPIWLVDRSLSVPPVCASIAARLTS